jgi:hypothetical protein
MGFSLSVSVRSHRLKEEMHGFLLTHYKPWSEIVEKEDLQDHFEGPYLDDELDTPGRCTLGFDYDPAVNGAEREYQFTLIRWIAIQVGKRRSTFRGEGLTLPNPVPYVLYDGIEAVPLLIQAEWSKVSIALRPFIIDGLGMKVDDVGQELAWYCLPEGVFERVTATHHGCSSDAIREALVKEGMVGALKFLQSIRTQVSQLDVLWRERSHH